MKNGLKVLLVTLGILGILSLLTAGNGYIYNFVSGYIITPMQYVLTGVVADTGNALAPEKSRTELAKENSRLLEENTRLNDMLADYYDMKEKYDELSAFLDMKEDYKSYDLCSAAVIMKDVNDSFCGFTLDRGLHDGVSLHDVVITARGLVGYVSKVDFTSCKVTTILSPDVKISCKDGKSSDKGVLTGSLDIYEKGLTCLKNIKRENNIIKGDIVVTADDSVYPSKIKVGKIKYIKDDDFTGMPVAVIEPFEDIKNVSSLVILRRSAN